MIVDKAAVPVRRVANGIVRVLGLNPSPFTLDGTNTYLLGNGERRVLVDTGDGEQPGYLDLLKQCLGPRSRIDRILLTHWHADHIGGVERLLDTPEIATADCVVYKHHCAATDEQKGVAAALACAQGRLLDIADSQVFDVDGAMHLQAVFTPGHTKDHMAFVARNNDGRPFENEAGGVGGQLVLTGDMVLGRGTTVIQELGPYMDSLRRLLGLGPTALLPGHGPVITGSDGARTNAEAVIQGYLEHRQARENQIVETLGTEPPSHPRNGRWWWRLEEITQAVYPDIKDPQLIRAAQNNARLHLEKLVDDGRVETTVIQDARVWALIRA
ncbi:Beta-lactamase-like protein 2 [Coemansia sp. RSA 552]|nr:Beta-lactamase-like protein 2 [Coemansia sp. RSA 552]